MQYAKLLLVAATVAPGACNPVATATAKTNVLATCDVSIDAALAWAKARVDGFPADGTADMVPT